MSPELASALDRTTTSNRNAIYVLAATAQSLKHNRLEITLNKESIGQACRRHRAAIAAEIRRVRATVRESVRERW